LEGKLPTELEHMTFSDYAQIVGDGRNWKHFQPIFKGDRVRTRTKLKRAGELRNDVFHFRREILVKDYEELSALRNWMLMKATAVDARTSGGEA
jgi:hypothetical protein